ncbi:MAG: hypothetical protein M1374_00160 [Firmicutes bacterium]|jgi:hypothetical protein|nr:hypothetical protein [Bacillota bacterium]
MENNDFTSTSYDDSHSHKLSNGKTELTLNQLGEVQPGMARLMIELSTRMSTCWWAAKYENFDLARYQMSESIKLLKTSVILRPKYGADVIEFIESYCIKLRDSLVNRDLVLFTELFNEMVTVANELHEKYGKGYLIWKVPSTPPGDLDLRPRQTVED